METMYLNLSPDAASLMEKIQVSPLTLFHCLNIVIFIDYAQRMKENADR
jgi:hypothetical protein